MRLKAGMMPYVIYIQLSCLAAILVMVAYNMSEWRTFLFLVKGDRQTKAVLLTTFLLTVVVDLTVAIEVGVLLAVVFFVARVMQTSSIEAVEAQEIAATESDEYNPEDTEYLDIPEGVQVYEIDGPYFFGLASKFEEFERRRKKNTRVQIIRMRKVPFMDATGVHNLQGLCDRIAKRGATVILSGVRPNVRLTLEKYGLDERLGKDHIQPHITPALEKARELLAAGRDGAAA